MKFRCLSVAISIVFGLTLSLSQKLFCAAATIDDAADLPTQQAQEKNELEDMRKEMQNIRSNMSGTMEKLDRVRAQHISPNSRIRDFQLEAKEGNCEVIPGGYINALTYNGQIPGPVIRVQEGDIVRIVLQNHLKTPTSLYLHGLTLPQNISGLPHKGGGLLLPGESFTYQFEANQVGTFFYHPQVTQLEQMSKGMFGAIVVEPKSNLKTYENDFVLVISETGNVTTTTPGNRNSPVFLVNGKSAPAISAIDVKNGERVRLRLINVSQHSCPLSLTGHKFEIVAQNGSEGTEPHVGRDTLTINPGERMDLEFNADNPGVWSLYSMLPAQSSYQGKFPGGIAVVLRYPDAMK